MFTKIFITFLFCLVAENTNCKQIRMKDVEAQDDVKFWTTSSYCPIEPTKEEEKYYRSHAANRQDPPLSPAISLKADFENIERLHRRKVKLLTADERTKINYYDFRHHDHANLQSIMENITEVCSDVAKMYSIGKTIQGEEMWVIEFSEHPGVHRVGEPEIRLTGNIHGNEVTGREILLQLIKYLCSGYLRNDPRVRKILASSRIHILPSMNPDGYKIATKQPRWRQVNMGRYNWQGKDLNRDFPILNPLILPFHKKQIFLNDQSTTSVKKSDITKTNVSELHSIHDGVWGFNAGCAGRRYNDSLEIMQPETKAVIRWMHSIPFVLSATLHDGGMGAIYPFDSAEETGVEAATPDDAVFRHLASTYANSHADMSDASKTYSDRWCRYQNRDFRSQGGISNGGKWYGISGSMEDYSYIATNTYGIAVELSCQKWISSYKVATEWFRNKNALLNFIEKSNLGIKGTVKHRISGKPLEGAVVHVSGILRDVTTTKDGEYWKLLLPGTYTVQARFGDLTSDVKIVEVKQKSRDYAMIVDFELF